MSGLTYLRDLAGAVLCDPVADGIAHGLTRIQVAEAGDALGELLPERPAYSSGQHLGFLVFGFLGHREKGELA